MAAGSESESVFEPVVYEVLCEHHPNVERSDQPIEHAEPPVNAALHDTLRESCDHQHVVRDAHH